MTDISLHTSGHADIETLQKNVNSINPKCLIQIHTSNPVQYKSLFTIPVKCLRDGEVFVL